MKVIHNQNLQEIIEGCQRGERLAQKKLYESLHGKMLSVCLRYATCRDDAVNVMNEGFFKVFTTLENFKSDIGNFEAWVYRIMVNASIDQYRKNEKSRLVKELDNNKVLIEDSFDIVDEISADEILSLVQELSPTYKLVFNLFVMEGMGHKEIAETLQISEGTSKSNLFKAKAKLQEMIKERHGHLYDKMVK